MNISMFAAGNKWEEWEEATMTSITTAELPPARDTFALAERRRHLLSAPPLQTDTCVCVCV